MGTTMKMQSIVFSLAIILLGSLACREEPKAGTAGRRPLLILTGSDVSTFDPQIPFEAETGYVLVNIFETLIEFDSAFRLSSGLAERWTNPDDRTWRFYLKDEARFSDGTRLRASDVKFSIERLKSLPHSDLQGFTEHIVSVNVVDSGTVDIKTDSPVSIPNNLVFIPIISEKHVTSMEEKKAEAPLGTGPYKLVRWEKGKRIVLSVNEYYKPPPSVQEVEFVISHGDPDKRLQDILRLKPDLAVTLSFRKMADFEKKKTPELKAISSPGIMVYYLSFNLKPTVPLLSGKNPFSDLRMRKAIAHATDRKEIIQSILKGYARPATQLVAPEVFGFDSSIAPPEYDVEKGKKLVAETGYSNVEIPVYVAEDGTHVFENLLIQQWQRIGLRGKLVLLKEGSTISELERLGNYVVALQGYSCTSGDAGEALTFCLHTRDDLRGYGKGNYGAYSNSDVDRMCEENLRIPDPRERLSMLQKSFQTVGLELPYLPLMVMNDLYVVSNRISWSPPPSGEMRIRTMSFKTP